MSHNPLIHGVCIYVCVTYRVMGVRVYVEMKSNTV